VSLRIRKQALGRKEQRVLPLRWNTKWMGLKRIEGHLEIDGVKWGKFDGMVGRGSSLRICGTL